jgi:hypothetical protein
LAQESQSKETRDLTKSKSDCSNVDFLSNNLNTSDDEGNDIYVVEFSWSSKDKSQAGS